MIICTWFSTFFYFLVGFHSLVCHFSNLVEMKKKTANVIRSYQSMWMDVYHTHSICMLIPCQEWQQSHFVPAINISCIHFSKLTMWYHVYFFCTSNSRNKTKNLALVKWVPLSVYSMYNAWITLSNNNTIIVEIPSNVSHNLVSLICSKTLYQDWMKPSVRPFMPNNAFIWLLPIVNAAAVVKPTVT